VNTSTPVPVQWNSVGSTRGFRPVRMANAGEFGRVQRSLGDSVVNEANLASGSSAGAYRSSRTPSRIEPAVSCFSSADNALYAAVSGKSNSTWRAPHQGVVPSARRDFHGTRRSPGNSAEHGR
jgi:hypothetical protein